MTVIYHIHCHEQLTYNKHVRACVLACVRACVLACVRAGVCVWWFESQLRPSFTYLGQLLRCAHKCSVNIMKEYIERNNRQVELIRFRKKNIDFIDVGIFEMGILSRPCLKIGLIVLKWH